MPKKTKKILTSPKGMHDILPDDMKLFNAARATIEKEAEFYNFLPIETPVLESIDLFERSIGEATEVVQKQMFAFTTKGGDRLALRPEGTAGVARAYIEHGLSHISQPLKLYYFGQMFRYEKPQAGRYRQFHQAGFEIFSNESDPIYDAQIILLCYNSLKNLGIKNLAIQINSIGDRNCRPAYIKKLVKYYKEKRKLLCPDCKIRLEKNPLRLLDCKEKSCELLKTEAPKLIDFLDADCRHHLRQVLEYLEELKLPYTLNTSLVRGLDYYTRTVFEIVSTAGDETDAAPDSEILALSLAGGGRFDYLIELLSGRKTFAVGAAIGIERVIDFTRSNKIQLPLPKEKPRVFLTQIGDAAKKKALLLIEKLKDAKIPVLEFLGKDSLKAQMRMADKFNAQLALILGQREVYEETIIIRDLKSGSQETVSLKNIVEDLKRRLK